MTSPTPDRPLQILIADDHAIVREGLKRVLESSAAGWTVQEAASGAEALERLRGPPFDLAIFDLSMPGMSGLDLLHRVRAAHRKLPVLMLSMHAEEQYAMRALKAGANGYVTKDSAARELADAVRKVAGGGIYVTAALAERLLLHASGALEPPSHGTLSDRELDILRRLVGGERPSDIAQALHLSVKTVSSHKARIQHKLQLPSTAALIRYGIEQGLAGAPVDAPPATPAPLEGR